MLYTRKGDKGTSGLWGTCDRFPKDSAIYEALGALDEVNSLIGFAIARIEHSALVCAPLEILTPLRSVQEHLFIAQAELAGVEKTIPETSVKILEALVNDIENRIGNPHGFVIPGATEISGLLDYARAVSRRAERAVIHAEHEKRVGTHTLAYLNRLSSLLYAFARFSAHTMGQIEKKPTYSSRVQSNI